MSGDLGADRRQLMALPVRLWEAAHLFLARWQSDMNDYGRNQRSADDEIDLIELVQAIWAEKITVLAFVVAATLGALAYSFSIPPQYSSSAVVSPAPVNSFGALAGELGALQADSSTFGIKAGIQVANDSFSIFTSNLESLSEQRAFREGFQSEVPFELSVNKGRGATDPFTVAATAGVAESPKVAVEHYLAYTARITAAQINGYFEGLDISQRIEPGSLYRLEQPAVVNSTPVQPRRTLIVALGFVLGGMLGVFVALVRIMLKKRASTN